MKLADQIRDRFIRRGSAIGALACLALTLADLLRNDLLGLTWNAWYFGSIVAALLVFQVTKSRMLWAIQIGIVPLVHLALAAGDHAFLSYFWVFPFPILAFFVLGLRRGLLVALGIWASSAAIILYRADSLGLADTAPDIVASLAVVTLLGWVYESLRDRHERELMRSLVTDELTGISNRRRFNEELDAEIQRADRYERPLSLLLFDLDDFKGINDANGHPVGDKVLVQLSKIVAKQLRASDLLARLGGDEFAIIAPETPSGGADSMEAVTIAERVRAAVEAHDFGIEREVTLSVGVTEYVPDDDHASIVQRADDALYLAKERGRNQVCTKSGRATDDSGSPDYLDRRAASGE